MAPLIIVLLCCHVMPIIGLTYTMEEGKPAGWIIGNIAQDADLSKEQEQHGSLKFNLLPHGYVHTHLFDVNEDSSELRTLRDLDREELCGITSPCVLDVVVGVLSRNGNFFQIVPVKITVQDINDNAPSFPQPILKVLIPESAIPGMYYNVPTAIDLDIGVNSVQTYELLTDSHLFNLHTSTNSDRTIDIAIVLNGTLDREKSAYYQLHVLAKDGGSPAKTGTATINVTVTDVNDHKPVFTKQKYEVSFMENTPVSETLVIVQAQDSDFQENGRVSYYFGLHTSKDTLNILEINESSGEIQLKGQLNYEMKKQYHFIVIASDHGSQPQTTQTAVIINVEDVNDNPPVLHFNLLSGGDFAVLAENATPDSFISHLSVADGDSGTNGKVKCRATTSGFQLRRLLSNEYKVLLNRTLDREQEGEHIVSVQCEDEGVPRMTGTGQVRVQVTDINDQQPVFNPTEYFKELYENNDFGEFITQVTATDADLGPNSQISFSLSSHQDLFEIESETGIISARMSLDREQYDSIELLVVARDHGDEPLSSTATVHVTLLDKNDVTPAFGEKSYHLYVMEEQVPGFYVGKVHAEDTDDGQNGVVKYTLLKTPSMDIPFLLDSATGVLITEQKLDRESQDSYIFVVAANDQGSDQLYSMVNVTVHVTDTNDNSPTFIYPKQSNNTKTIYHTDYVGTLITKIKAQDKDRGENATITYKILSGNPRNLFQIHPTTGEVFVVNEMSESDIAIHHLSISASDNGQVPKENITQFIIDVQLGNSTLLPASTLAEQEEEPEFDNLIIGVTIAVTTVLLALVITVIIILVKRRNKPPQEFPRSESQHMMAYGDSGLGANQPQCAIVPAVSLPRHGDICRQVNFSLTTESHTSVPSNTFSTFKGENSLSSLDQNSMQQPKACSSMLTINAQSPGKVETVLAGTSESDGRPERAKLQRPQSMNMWPSGAHNSTYTIIQVPDAHRLDNHSDMSGEVTNSDSGRGGSEEELPDPRLNQKVEERKPSTSPSKPKKRVQLVDPVLTEESNIHQRIKKWMAEHDPESAYYQINVDSDGNYPLPCDQLKQLPNNSSYMPPSILKNSPQHKNYQKSSPSRREGIMCNNSNPPMVTFGYAPNPAHQLQGGVVYKTRVAFDDESDIMTDSVRDDDDGETTTSGSYVINADDLYNEINDLFFTDGSHPVPS